MLALRSRLEAVAARRPEVELQALLREQLGDAGGGDARGGSEGEAPLLRLQRAVGCQAAGQLEAARALVVDLTALPPGLEAVHRQVLAQTAAAVPQDEDDAAVAEVAEVANGAEAAGDRGIASPILAALHAAQGDSATAIAMYRQLLQQNPDDLTSRRALDALLGDAAAPAARLQQWLTTVRAWREVLGV